MQRNRGLSKQRRLLILFSAKPFRIRRVGNISVRSKVTMTLLIGLICISLSACGKANSSSGSSASGSNPPPPAAASSSAAGSSSSGEAAASPTDPYQAVLQNQAVFFSADDQKEYLLNDFLSRNAAYEGTYQVTQFAVLDMDGDQVPEVVLELSLHDSPEQCEILQETDGTVSGYNFTYRGFEQLKADGTFRYANGAADGGIEKIRSFRADAAETETLGYVQTGSDGSVSYSVGGEPAAKEAYDTLSDQQDGKADAQWLPFTPENIEASIRNTAQGAAAADSSKSYYGTWTVQKVLAYGIGTYSRDDAERLMGKSLSFSADEADLFADQPSDTPSVIYGPEYREATMSDDDFQTNYKMSFDTLGIQADSVTEVQITGADGMSGVLLVKSSDTIILAAGGTYFELIRK